MIIITGAAGFIGSSLIWRLNQDSITDILAVDSIANTTKWRNLVKSKYSRLVHKKNLFSYLQSEKLTVSAVVHLGACSSTTESNFDYLLENNIDYSISLFQFCQKNSIPFIYASSAATYGTGDLGYDDNIDTMQNLRPINAYGYSKKLFDDWVLAHLNECPPFCVGLKFFNVLGLMNIIKEI